MKIKHPFALLAPLVFLALAACADVTGVYEVKVTFVIDCPLPVPTITDPDSLATWYNGACAYWWWDGDTLRFYNPGAMG